MEEEGPQVAVHGKVNSLTVISAAVKENSTIVVPVVTALSHCPLAGHSVVSGKKEGRKAGERERGREGKKGGRKIVLTILLSVDLKSQSSSNVVFFALDVFICIFIPYKL